jgi:iron complex transport system ATP-binding protein
MSALLEMANVTVALGVTRALEDLSLRVGAGEIVAVLGPNGAGKTTLLRAGLGLIASTGAIALSGRDPRHASARERALLAAYLPQRPQSVWPISAEALVALGRFAHGAAPEKLGDADRAAVDAAVDACGLQDLRKRRMDELSGGEKSRVHLARTLAQGAPLILLDEPTAGLDPAQAIKLHAILRKAANDGCGVVLSTHDIALAANLAGRVVVMREGRALAEGAPASVLTSEMLFSAYGVPAELIRVGGAYAATFAPRV